MSSAGRNVHGANLGLCDLNSSNERVNSGDRRLSWPGCLVTNQGG